MDLVNVKKMGTLDFGGNPTPCGLNPSKCIFLSSLIEHFWTKGQHFFITFGTKANICLGLLVRPKSKQFVTLWGEGQHF